MGSVIRQNERSWAIELISIINEFVQNNDLVIKRAGGENTIAFENGSRMFPDVILYGNQEKTFLLQGWELKMPDVPIEDGAFIRDAQRKADALNLNSCMIWNFRYAVLYMRREDGEFERAKEWNDTSFIRTRQDVEAYRDDWEKLLKKILLDLNDYFLEGKFRQNFIGDAISNKTLVVLMQRNQKIVAECLHHSANRDTRIEAFINLWWREVKSEYEYDESDSYSAYAKTVVLNWMSRITFAHLIKSRQNAAREIDKLDSHSTIEDGNLIFQKITDRCDFYNIFTPVEYGECLPEPTWNDLVEYSLFLKDNGISELDQEALQAVMEGSVNALRRQLNGQFTTPYELAKILVRITMLNCEDDFMDCCCGTGTIARAAIDLKKERLGTGMAAKRAIETVWASDKYSFPLQVANLSMASADSINIANRLFQRDALKLNVFDEVEIINPQNGETLALRLPAMGAIASNLPFVESGKLVGDSDTIFAMNHEYQLNARSDLYFYIALKIADILKPDGRLGIITSNSWFGTEAGMKFVSALNERYDMLQVHMSGKGRWFQNADVVTTIILLKKKGDVPADKTHFYLWKKSLREFELDKDLENCLINSSLLEKEVDPDVCTVSSYTRPQLDKLLKINVSFNAFFYRVQWLDRFAEITVPIREIFNVFRGSRRGWDALFYPKKGEHRIEGQYLQKVLRNSRSVDYLVTTADNDVFCCNVALDALKQQNHIGALEWIQKFANQTNGTGKPLPEALKRSGMQWYEIQTSEKAELFTSINPDKRVFFARFDGAPAFINQRLVGLRHREGLDDIDFYHALLNSIFTVFCIESAGFGRGLGVLDINKDRLEFCRMFRPDIVSKADRDRIVKAFEKIKSRKIMQISDELNDRDRMDFERIVFSAYGVDDVLHEVCESVLAMQQTRETVKHS